MLIVEGIDGVGKTTLVNFFEQIGMEKFHFDYDLHNMDLMSKYMGVLSYDNCNSYILDRSFISEMVYGPVIRNFCKLTLQQYTELLRCYDRRNAQIIYLTAPKEVLLDRRKNDEADYVTLINNYDRLNHRYNEIMKYSSNYIDVISCDTYINNVEEVQDYVKRMIKK